MLGHLDLGLLDLGLFHGGGVGGGGLAGGGGLFSLAGSDVLCIFLMVMRVVDEIGR